MAAKIATRNKTKKSDKPVEMFRVVKLGTTEPVYLGGAGMTREVADRTSAGLLIPTEVIPVEAPATA